MPIYRVPQSLYTAPRRAWKYRYVPGGGGHAGFFMILCCLLALLTGCSNLLNGVDTSSSSTASTLAHTKTTPTSGITPTPTTDPLATAKQKVQQIMAGMTLDQKLGQLIIVEYWKHDYEASDLHYMIAQQYVGGFLYQESNGNFNAPDNVIANVAGFSQQATSDAKIPLLIGTDQEGGLVNRLQVFHGDLPSAEEMAAKGDPQFAHDQGTQAAQWMRQLGINTDLAPVVDVHTIDPPVLETRMFGNTPQTVATYAGAYLDGLQQNRVIGTLKHFPGLGAITSDPHAGLPTVNRSLPQLQSIDLAPYTLMMQKNHPAMIMDTDVLMPAIDPLLPAELSPKTIDGLLRGKMGYDGVVITDGLYMGGISAQWTLSQASVLAIIAGNDLVEGPYTAAQVAGVVTALKQAMQQGQISMNRLNKSVERILLMKVQYGIIK